MQQGGSACGGGVPFYFFHITNIHWGCQTIKHHVIMGCMDAIKLGKKIKNLRKNRVVTQEKLAELTEISYKYIQRIEGKNPPDVRLTTVVKLAKALKVKPAELLKS